MNRIVLKPIITMLFICVKLHFLVFIREYHTSQKTMRLKHIIDGSIHQYSYIIENSRYIKVKK